MIPLFARYVQLPNSKYVNAHKLGLATLDESGSSYGTRVEPVSDVYLRVYGV